MQATGWSKRFNIKASSRDMASQSWKKVIGAVEAAGFAPSALCAAPQAHRVGAGGGNCYLLGLPHLKALYFVANLLERWTPPPPPPPPRIHPLGCCLCRRGTETGPAACCVSVHISFLGHF